MKVNLHFTLVGKTYADIKKHGSPGFEWSNKDTFEDVKTQVVEQFGGRALVVANERLLNDNSVSYPPFYSAGWFLSGDCKSELVVLAHGDTMEEATHSMMEFVKTLSWTEHSVRT